MYGSVSPFCRSILKPSENTITGLRPGNGARPFTIRRSAPSVPLSIIPRRSASRAFPWSMFCRPDGPLSGIWLSMASGPPTPAMPA